MGFFDSDRWDEIWQTISRNRKRSIMTALGVFWGIFMLTILLGAGMGLGRMFRSQLGEMSVNAALMYSNRTSIPYKGMPTGRWWSIYNEDAEALRKLKEVEYVAGIAWSDAQQHFSHEERKADYSVVGYEPEFQKINPHKLLFGRYINKVDMQHKRKVCVIGTQVWKDLFPGGENPEGKIIKMNGFYFTVVGVIARQGGMMVFSDIERTVILPLTLFQQMFNFGRHLDIVSASAHPGVTPKQLKTACKNAIYAHHIISPDDEKALWFMSANELVGKINGLFSGIALLTWVVGLGSLIAGIVGVSNIMLVLVKERTQEIGIRRAIGAPPRAIIVQILSESFVLTFIAGVMGLTAAVGILSAADSIFYQLVTTPGGPEISWQISFGMGMLSLAILITGSLLAGIIPAIRALKIKAVDAIREE